jgi:hypothetical protein
MFHVQMVFFSFCLFLLEIQFSSIFYFFCQWEPTRLIMLCCAPPARSSPVLEMLAVLPRIASGWVAANSQWVGLFFPYGSNYGVFSFFWQLLPSFMVYLDIMSVRWSYVRVVFVLRRLSILTGRVTFVRVLASSHQLWYDLRFSLQFSYSE